MAKKNSVSGTHEPGAHLQAVSKVCTITSDSLLINLNSIHFHCFCQVRGQAGRQDYWYRYICMWVLFLIIYYCGYIHTYLQTTGGPLADSRAKVWLMLWENSNCNHSNPTAAFKGCNHRLGAITWAAQLCESGETSLGVCGLQWLPTAEAFLLVLTFLENMQFSNSAKMKPGPWQV